MPPANDAFADAVVLTGDTGSVSGTTVDATTEVGEPDLYYGSPDTHSVWYQWTATDHGYLTIDSTGTPGGSPQILFFASLYEGTAVDALTLVGYAAWWNYDTINKLFSVPGAGTYYIRVLSGYDTKYGPFTINWSFQQADPVANDDWADAIAISGASGSIVGTTFGSTAEPDEPDNYNSEVFSVWYRWTATDDGYLTLNNAGTAEIPGVYLFLWVYQGPDLVSLERLGTGAGEDFGGAFSNGVSSVRAGHDYYIVAATRGSIGGPFTLNWSLEAVTPPSNDDIADAQVLTGTSGSVAGTLRGAGREPNEYQYDDYGSIWYSWTAPDSGAARFDTEGTEFWDWGSGLAMWSGGPGMLDLVDEDYWEEQSGADPYFDVITFEAVEGTTYYIRLIGEGWEVDNPVADTVLNWHLGIRGAPPANDDWANATLISGTSGTISGTTLGATVQDGNPNYEDYYGNATVWYRMVVTEDTLLTFTCISDALQPMLSLYTIDEGDPVQMDWLNQWWQESGNLQPDYLNTFFSETLTPGTWWIQVGSADDGYEGDFELSWLSPPSPIITSFTPTSGPIGTEVTITGENFEGRGFINVYIGGAYSGSDVINDTTIVATAGTWHLHNGAPHGGVGPVEIWSDLGHTTSTQTFTSPVVTPIVTSFTPDAAYPGEDNVTVTGTNFYGANEVLFGSGGTTLYGSNGQEDSDTVITAQVALNATPGPVGVRHHNQVGSSAASIDVPVFTQIPTVVGTQPTVEWSSSLAPYVWYAQPGAPNNSIVFFRDWEEQYEVRYQTVNDSDVFNIYAVDEVGLGGPPGSYPPGPYSSLSGQISSGRGRMELLQRQSDGTFVHKGSVRYSAEERNGAEEFGQALLAGGKIVFAYPDWSINRLIHGGTLAGYTSDDPPLAFQLVTVSEDASMSATVHPRTLASSNYGGRVPFSSGGLLWDGNPQVYGDNNNNTGEGYWDAIVAENKMYIGAWVNKPLCAFPGTTYALFTYISPGAYIFQAPRCEVLDCSGSEALRPPNMGEDGTYPFGPVGTLLKSDTWPHWMTVTPVVNTADGGYTYVPDRSESIYSYLESFGIDATRALVFGCRRTRVHTDNTEYGPDNAVYVATVLTRSGQQLTAGTTYTVLDNDEPTIEGFEIFDGDYLQPRDFTFTKLGDGRYLMTICPVRDSFNGDAWQYSITWFRVITVTGTTVSVGPLGRSWRKTPRYGPNVVYPYGGGGDFFLVDTWPPADNWYISSGSHRDWGYNAQQRVQAWRAEADGEVHPVTGAMLWPFDASTEDRYHGVAGRWCTNPQHPELNTLPAAMLYLNSPTVGREGGAYDDVFYRGFYARYYGPGGPGADATYYAPALGGANLIALVNLMDLVATGGWGFGVTMHVI